jgi:rubrerythrin
MMTPTMPDAYVAAMDFEEKGWQFYRRTAETVTDPLSRKLFQTLAKDEKRHQERIREIYARLQSGTGWPTPQTSRRVEMETEIQSFFQENRSRLRREATNLAGYEFAMSMEKTGIELYRRLVRETTQTSEREFFEALLAEELLHLEALRNVHFFLTQPGDWLQEDESRHWNWMNL